MNVDDNDRPTDMLVIRRSFFATALAEDAARFKPESVLQAGELRLPCEYVAGRKHASRDAQERSQEALGGLLQCSLRGTRETVGLPQPLYASRGDQRGRQELAKPRVAQRLLTGLSDTCPPCAFYGE